MQDVDQVFNMIIAEYKEAYEEESWSDGDEEMALGKADSLDYSVKYDLLGKYHSIQDESQVEMIKTSQLRDEVWHAELKLIGKGSVLLIPELFLIKIEISKETI